MRDKIESSLLILSLSLKSEMILKTPITKKPINIGKANSSYTAPVKANLYTLKLLLVNQKSDSEMLNKKSITCFLD